MKTDRIVKSIAESVLDSRLTTVSQLTPDSVLSRVDAFMSGMPRVTQKLLKVLIIYFEWSALWGGCFSRFSKLPAGKRREYISRFSNSRNRFKRDIARILKSLCHTAFFNLPELWDHLGYSPDKHLRQAVTERVLRLSADQAASEKERDRVMLFSQRKTMIPVSVFSPSVRPAAIPPYTGSRGSVLEEGVVMS